MTAVQPIAAVTTAPARLRTHRWLGGWHAQTVAESPQKERAEP
jgi:hypothetical protein